MATKLSYGRYAYRGQVIERSCNPDALPTFRWNVVEGIYAHACTLRGLEREIDIALDEAAAKEVV